MSSTSVVKPRSKMQFWAGCIVSALPVLALIMSAVMKFLQPPEVVQGFAKLGFPEELAFGLAVVEIICTALYVIPPTSVLGAILLTGYLGGATATHVRVGDNFAAPVILGMLVWAGLFLRDRRVSTLIPFKTQARNSI